MGDYSEATITLYGVKGKEEAIIKGSLREFSVIGSEQDVTPADIEDGVELMIYEIGTGFCSEDKLTYLRELGVSYFAWQDSGEDWPGECEMFTPALGVFTASALKDVPAVEASKIDELLSDESLDDEGLRRRLNLESGKAHRDAFKALSEVAA